MANQPSLVVGLGASAGGIQAFKSFFGEVPEKTDMAFVVVTHLSPDRESLLHEVIRRFTTLSVEVIKDGDPLRSGTVHVMPENVALSITDGHLHLLEFSPTHRERKPIDVFFSALAVDQQERAVGIVLSGGDGDGTLGVQAIKKHGGVTFAQVANGDGPNNPEMPESAIASGWVDFAQSAEQMPGTLCKINKMAASASINVRCGELDVSDSEKSRLQNEISSLLRSHAGQDFRSYKTGTFFRRVARRMHVVQTSTPEAYLERLREDPEEVMALFSDLLISVTDFFRDEEAFNSLKEHVIPNLLADRDAKDTLRVWVPGCATGQEVYSLAILILEQLKNVSPAPKVQIFATDIDASALAVARAGRYPEPLLTNVSEDRKARFFQKDGASRMIASDVREMCIFSSHSLISDPPFSRMGLVSCRNLLIYLGADLQKQVVPTFHYALKPGGFLFLGSSESLNQSDNLFTSIDKRHRIYQSLDLGDQRPRLPIPIEEMRGAAHRFDHEYEMPQRMSKHNIRQRAEHQVMERHSPAHVVVRSEGDIVYYSSRTGRYFDTPRGAPNRQLFEIVRRELRHDLRSALREVLETGHSAVRHAVMPDEEAALDVAMTVEPLDNGAGDEARFLVVFRPVGALRPRSHESERTEAGQADAEATERELREVRERLRSIVEDYETALEELKSSNEELVSVNEEAQSTNEEMQASKEEMQSLNEELSTVNSELNNKVEELARANIDLRNLYYATGVSSLFLDEDLIIRKFTPAAGTFFNLRSSDIGRPMTDLATTIEYPLLKQDIREVLETGQQVERRLPPNGQPGRYLMRSAPYYDGASITGAVVTFVDVTQLTEAEEQRKVMIREAQEADARLLHSQKLEAIGRLTGGVAHDFNNLLMVIIGNAEMLGDSLEENDQLRPLADTTLQAAERGAELVARLMAFSRLQPLAPRTVDMNAVVSDVESMIRRTLSTEIDVELSLEANLWMAEADLNQSEVALLNLVINARDAMPDGGKLLIQTSKIALEKSEIDGQDEIPSGNYVVVTVSDTGVGMPAQVLNRVYEPFFTTKGEGSGNGLGLPSVHGFMKQSHGHIKIDSEVGKGTTVRLYFPKASADGPETAVSEQDEIPPGDGEHILVVEDDIQVRALATALIRSLGYHVIEANSGQEAMKVIKSGQPVDLLFTDVVMPGGMDGKQLADAAATIRPDLKVLFTSGYAENTIVDQGKLAPDVALLSKPYRLKPLARKIRAALGMR